MDALPAKSPRESLPLLGLLSALWGTVGVALLLGQALRRLAPLALEPLQSGELTLMQALLYAAWVIFMAYSEGYRGFQLRFAPSCAARALNLAQSPTPVTALLAPAYCMGLFAAPRRRMVTSWALVIGITCLVMLVKLLQQPWRGIVDGGVVVGLSWGLIAVVVSTIATFRSALARSS